MRPLSKISPEWWDYTTLDSKILDDAARRPAGRPAAQSDHPRAPGAEEGVEIAAQRLARDRPAPGRTALRVVAPQQCIICMRWMIGL